MRQVIKTGKPFNAEVRTYDKCKYRRDSVRTSKTVFEEVDYLEILSGEEAVEEESKMFPWEFDDFGEYVIIHFTDDSTARFQNSRVDVFKVDKAA